MNKCYLFCVVKKNNRKLRGVNFFFFLCVEMKSTFGVAIQLLNATRLQILITRKKGKRKNILAEFFRNANQVLKLLDCRAINIPTRDLVSITSSHKTRVPLCSGGCGKHLLSFSL